MRMKIIEAALKPDHEIHQQASSNSNAEPGDIDHCISFVAEETSESDYEIIPYHNLNYSVRKLFTGFASAARIALTLTVSNAIIIAQRQAAANIHQLIFIR